MDIIHIRYLRFYLLENQPGISWLILFARECARIDSGNPFPLV